VSERTITYLEDEGIVWVRTSGTYVLAAEIETLKKALEMARGKNCKKLLFDHRKARVVAPTMESFDRPSVYRGLGFDSSFRVASLLTDICEDLRFYETVCVNRGWNMKVFDDFDSAMGWLEG